MFKKSTVFILHCTQPAFYSQPAFYTQSAFYPWSAVCSLQSAVYVLHWPTPWLFPDHGSPNVVHKPEERKMHRNNTLREHNNKTLRLTNASKIFLVASKFSETQNFLSSIHQRLLAFPCTSITICKHVCVFSTCRVARVLGRLFSFRNCWISRITLKENKTRVNKAEIHAINQSIDDFILLRL